MAKETKNVPVKKEKASSGGNRFFAGIVAIPKRMLNAVQKMIAELKIVTWPTRKDLINYTALVLVFMVLMAVVVGFFDLGASKLISLIITRQ